MSAALLSNLNACAAWLGRSQHSHRRYVGASQHWHLSQSGFMARFSQMLLSRLRRVFEGAASEIALCTREVNRLRILVATPPAADGAQRRPHLQRVPARGAA